ncbi:MAG: mechanosensitive ion channel [Rhodocyclaceae bacterium]|nr:mechanosensitive ion channel [Rhodocyclaceae bacterium]
MESTISEIVEQAGRLLAELATPAVYHQLAVLMVAAVCGWMAGRYVDRTLQRRLAEASSVGLRRFALRTAQRLLYPAVLLLLILLGRGFLLARHAPTALLDVAVPLLLSLAAIRLAIYVLRKGFPVTPALKAWENIITGVVWVTLALHLVGWLPAVADTLDALAFKVGNSRVSLLATLQLVGLIALLLTLAFWVSGVIERRMRASPYVTPSLQVALGKFSKFFLITLAFLVAIDAAGIDLSTMAVFGGALGVGIGFGLQRITSNFISGFILVLDRSIKPGDVISVGADDNTFGWVQELRARYVVVRNRDGVERLIPNEKLITSEVVNWSFSDDNTRIKLPVQISYRDDPEQAMALLLEAARASSRVIVYPPPAARLMAFGESGIDLELRVWIDDPQNGIGNVRTDINLAIWKLFKQAGITIPYPQRDVHLSPPPPNQGSAAAGPATEGGAPPPQVG